MTNKEALKAQFMYPVKDSAIDLALLNAGSDPDAEYVPEDSKQGVETALAGLILIVLTAPKSISELDFSMSSQDIDDLLKLRSLILSRYGIPDELAFKPGEIIDATGFWGSANY